MSQETKDAIRTREEAKWPQPEPKKPRTRKRKTEEFVVPEVAEQYPDVFGSASVEEPPEVAE